jgi:hypothetical protein
MAINGDGWDKRSPDGSWMRMTKWIEPTDRDKMSTLSSPLTVAFTETRCGRVKIWYGALPNVYNDKPAGPIEIIWKRDSMDPEIQISETSEYTAGLAWAIGEKPGYLKPSTYTGYVFINGIIVQPPEIGAAFYKKIESYKKLPFTDTSPDTIQAAWDAFIKKWEHK